MKRVLNQIIINPVLVLLLITGCGGSKGSEEKAENTQQRETVQQTQEIDPMKDKGIGPIKEVKMTPQIDKELAKKGEEIFKTKCSVCHKLDERYVGPALKGVTKRRTPEWIMNMILNPEEMTKNDPIAKKLLEEYLTQMTFQNVSEDEARAILEYFRLVDSQE
ncbi:MAG: cytochrome c [candidate division WOR-3 bacterium]